MSRECSGSGMPKETMRIYCYVGKHGKNKWIFGCSYEDYGSARLHFSLNYDSFHLEKALPYFLNAEFTSCDTLDFNGRQDLRAAKQFPTHKEDVVSYQDIPSKAGIYFHDFSYSIQEHLLVLVKKHPLTIRDLIRDPKRESAKLGVVGDTIKDFGVLTLEDYFGVYFTEKGIFGKEREYKQTTVTRRDLPDLEYLHIVSMEPHSEYRRGLGTYNVGFLLKTIDPSGKQYGL